MTKPTQLNALDFFKGAISILVIAGLAISFTISFASFVYSGALEDHLSKGIGLAFLALAVMPVITGALTRFPGSIANAQDAPALLLATAAAAMAVDIGNGSEALFATVATFIGCTTLLTGVALLVAGQLKLGSLARFIPYSVVGGFLAATGVLLTLGAFAMVLKEPMSIWNIPVLFTGDATMRLGPWLLFSILVVLLNRSLRNESVLPLSLAIGGALFFAALYGFGLSIRDASDLGLLLGPFEGDNFLSEIDPRFPLDARWDVIAVQFPSMISVVAISFLGLLLNTSGLEIEEKTPVSFETELKAAGLGNIGAGLLGGLAGFHFLSITLLARRMGLTSILGALAISASALVVLFAGADLVAAIPVGLMASVIMILGLDLAYTWLWVHWRRASRADMFTIFAIVLTAVTIGLLPSLLVGLIIAVVFFLISYSRIDPVARQIDGALRRSFVERSQDEMAYLENHGSMWRIYELKDYIFFGSVNGLYKRVRKDLEQPNAPHTCVLDFTAVSGIDSSAQFGFSRILDLCNRLSVTLKFTSLSPEITRQFGFSDELKAIPVFKSLDDALIDLETACLEGGFLRGGQEQVWLTDLRSMHPDIDFDAFMTVTRLAQGDMLVNEGANSKEFFQLCEGELIAEVRLPDGQTKIVAQFLPGAVFGELAVLAGVPRTASIRATTTAAVATISFDQIPDTPKGRSVEADLTMQISKTMAQRIIRMTNLARNTGG